jgi:hypothetical protein
MPLINLCKPENIDDRNQFLPLKIYEDDSSDVNINFSIPK